ncbi:hypothetical protein ACN20G_16960 [Streptomyces sp. BI20]|uniref:hypothetical protein n=1 Tax=Streptomyces sp. BI20 TaxID=3403460 RepID=UPI003C790C7F
MNLKRVLTGALGGAVAFLVVLGLLALLPAAVREEVPAGVIGGVSVGVVALVALSRGTR